MAFLRYTFRRDREVDRAVFVLAAFIEAVALSLPLHKDGVSALPFLHISLDSERRIRAMHFANGLLDATGCDGIKPHEVLGGLVGTALPIFQW